MDTETDSGVPTVMSGAAEMETVIPAASCDGWEFDDTGGFVFGCTAGGGLLGTREIGNVAGTV